MQLQVDANGRGSTQCLQVKQLDANRRGSTQRHVGEFSRLWSVGAAAGGDLWDGGFCGAQAVEISVSADVVAL